MRLQVDQALAQGPQAKESRARETEACRRRSKARQQPRAEQITQFGCCPLSRQHERAGHCRVLAEVRHATSPSRARARCAGFVRANVRSRSPRAEAASAEGRFSTRSFAPLTSASARQCQDGETGARDPRHARSAVSPHAGVFGSGPTSAQFRHWSPGKVLDPDPSATLVTGSALVRRAGVAAVAGAVSPRGPSPCAVDVAAAGTLHRGGLGHL
jgi:hypothetical protein